MSKHLERFETFLIHQWQLALVNTPLEAKSSVTALRCEAQTVSAGLTPRSTLLSCHQRLSRSVTNTTAPGSFPQRLYKFSTLFCWMSICMTSLALFYLRKQSFRHLASDIKCQSPPLTILFSSFLLCCCPDCHNNKPYDLDKTGGFGPLLLAESWSKNPDEPSHWKYKKSFI